MNFEKGHVYVDDDKFAEIFIDENETDYFFGVVPNSETMINVEKNYYQLQLCFSSKTKSEKKMKDIGTISHEKLKELQKKLRNAL